MRNKYSTWIVRYWNHNNKANHPLNDCFGNSISWVGKARTQSEAFKKAEKFNKKLGNYLFRPHSSKIL